MSMQMNMTKQQNINKLVLEENIEFCQKLESSTEWIVKIVTMKQHQTPQRCVPLNVVSVIPYFQSTTGPPDG